MLLTEQDIRDTLNSYNAEGAADTEEFYARMHEVQTHVATARELLVLAGREMEHPTPNSAHDLIDLAKSYLAHALTAWD
jgi:hypothetical protein